MSKISKEKMKLTAELMRRGGVMLREPCQTCGGIQLKYHGKNYCTNHDDFSSILSTEELTYDQVVARLRELILQKIRDATAVLREEGALSRQDEIVTLLTKYVELMQKLPEAR